MNVTDYLLRAISRLWFRVFGENKLKIYEEVCLNAMSEKITKQSKEKLNAQLQKFNLIQRPAYGMKSVFHDTRDPDYSTWSDRELFANRSTDAKAFSGFLLGYDKDLRAKIKFEIYIHRGRLSSIEFASDPRVMGKLEKLEIENSKLLIEF